MLRLKLYRMYRTVDEFEIGLLGKLYARRKLIEKEVANALLGRTMWLDHLDPTKEEEFRDKILEVLPYSAYCHIVGKPRGLITIKQEP